MEQIAQPENLRLAFWKAARGKWKRAEVRCFAQHLNAELCRMRDGLMDGSYPVGKFHHFVVRDPKEREIYAAAFPERVLQHAIMNVCEPVFERLAIFDSYACRRGKGQWKAVARAERFASQNPFFLKMDIRKYFDSISHHQLLGLLEHRFKDRRLLAWFEKLLISYETTEGRGLPIGSLTSQHLANFYLLPLEQRSAELPIRQPQQQRPVESQQQQRIPGCPSSDQGRMAPGTEPAVVLSTGGSDLGGKMHTHRSVPVSGCGQTENSERSLSINDGLQAL